MRHLRWLMAAAAVLIFFTASGALAQQAGTASDTNDVKIGYLSCNVASGFGIVFGSSRDLDCTYSPTAGDPEYYKGEINKFGADIGYVASGVMLWGVFAPANTVGKGTLSGHYAGATAGATLGAGGEAHTLIGGMHSSIQLQPLAIQGNTGLNVAAGVATMNLEYVLPKH